MRRKSWPPAASVLEPPTQAAGRDLRAATHRLHVSREGLGLRLGVPVLLGRLLGRLPVRRHPAGADLEVGRGRTDADQRGTAVRDALQVCAVASDAAGREKLAAGVNLRLRGGRVGRARRLGEQPEQATHDGQRHERDDEAGEPPPPARQCPPATETRRPPTRGRARRIGPGRRNGWDESQLVGVEVDVVEVVGHGRPFSGSDRSLRTTRSRQHRRSASSTTQRSRQSPELG